MKKIFTLAVIGIFAWIGLAGASTVGKILLQVENNGEAWYVNPVSQKRYFLGRPQDAFDVMRLSGVGITNRDINKIPVSLDSLGSLGDQDSDNDGFSDKVELLNGFNPNGDGPLMIDPGFSNLHKGKIFLQIENNGEAWYVSPDNGERYFLGRPQDAFDVMRELGLGITNNDLSRIPEGNINNIEEEKTEIPKVATMHDIPFSPQAPFGNWADSRQEDGCEEISSLMAVRWAKGEGLTRDEALEELMAMAAYQDEKYGNYHDTSAYDTMTRLIKGYLEFDNVEYRTNITKQDMISELMNGKLLIVPVDGTAIGNPYYTQPGPPRHMLVVKGYDNVRDVFITNDPGTRRGEGYEYSGDKFYSAIRDYQSGLHKDVFSVKKNILVVSSL